jgi:glycosyltransferase involved in cell wall biosynthesis
LRIVQVGAYPPPYGGVTVHLARLHEHLCRAGMDHTVVDLSAVPKQAPGVVRMSWSEATSWLARLPRSIVHFHNFAPGRAGAYGRAARRHVALLSLHNERFGEELEALGPLGRRVALARLRRLHGVVVDSERCRRLAADLWGARMALHVIPEFIPPASVPPLDRPEVLELRRRCRFLLASNAWQAAVHRGQDLYGLDLLVEALRRLVGEHGLDAGLVLLLPGADAAGAPPWLLERIEAGGLSGRVVLVTEPLAESSSLWREADLVLRATNTDGSSLTVLEALAVGTPVVASDCVERPAGTVLFRNRDAGDLTARVAEVLSDLPAQAERACRAGARSSAAAFAALYDGLREAVERAHA